MMRVPISFGQFAFPEKERACSRFLAEGPLVFAAFAAEAQHVRPVKS